MNKPIFEEYSEENIEHQSGGIYLSDWQQWGIDSGREMENDQITDLEYDLWLEENSKK